MISHSTSRPVDAIILAAGQGTRMGSDQPKVLFEVADKPMVQWVVEACLSASVDRCIIVIGHGGDSVKQALADYPNCQFVLQAQRLGTGHATQMAQPLFENQSPRDVFVLAGDGPLIRSNTLDKLLDVHCNANATATLATAVIDDPSGYGRVVRDQSNNFQAIVEQKDATEEQLAICEVNPSYYCFQSEHLFDSLAKVKNNNKQGEYYLTDVPGLLKQSGHTVAVVDAVPPADVLSINTPAQLAEVDQILRQRLQTK